MGEALELLSNREDLATSNGVLYRKWKPSNQVNECWQAIIPKDNSKGDFVSIARFSNERWTFWRREKH